MDDRDIARGIQRQKDAEGQANAAGIFVAVIGFVIAVLASTYVGGGFWAFCIIAGIFLLIAAGVTSSIRSALLK